MACNTSIKNVRIEPCNLSWGRSEKTCVEPVYPVVVASHFLLSSESADYYVWFDTTGTDVDPAPAGRTGIKVDVSSDTTVAGVVTSAVAAIEADGNFFAKASEDGLSFVIENKEIGKVLSTASDSDTTFMIHVISEGIGGDLGYTNGAIELTMTTESIDLVVNQTGTTLVDKFVNGHNASISCELAEMSKEQWALIVGEGLGGKYTPASGTEVVGYGLDGIGKSYFSLGGRLVLHPVNLPSTDKSRDITFFNTIPDPESINFDSQAQQGMSVTFNALPDENIKSSVNVFAFGDSSQDLRA